MLLAVAGLRYCNGLSLYRLLAADGAGRASVGASAAVDADVGIDGVDVALSDGAGRAFTLAGSASNASLRIDFVCHNQIKLVFVCAVLFKNCANIHFPLDKTKQSLYRISYLCLREETLPPSIQAEKAHSGYCFSKRINNRWGPLVRTSGTVTASGLK